MVNFNNNPFKVVAVVALALVMSKTLALVVVAEAGLLEVVTDSPDPEVREVAVIVAAVVVVPVKV